MKNKRIVLDTNILISHAILKHSETGRIASHLIKHNQILYSSDTIAELVDVLYRDKFDPYITNSERQAYISKLMEEGLQISITEQITDCEDPKDDKFLELAVSGNADVIISGDAHLYEMNPFRGIQILRPKEIEVS